MKEKKIINKLVSNNETISTMESCTGGYLVSSLTNVDFTNALIAGANFSNTTGFTKEQLYSTSSYNNNDLQKIKLQNIDLSSWDFANKNLKGANFKKATITNANFKNSDITGVDFSYTALTNAQLVSTVNYKNKNLSEMRFLGVRLSGIDLNGCNLTGTNFRDADLSNANLSGANLTNAYLYNADLSNANLSGADITRTSFSGDANFKNANLSGLDFRKAFIVLRDTNFEGANLENVNLSGIDIWYATFNDAIITGANFSNPNLRSDGLYDTTTITVGQICSTKSYKDKNLRGVGLSNLDLRGGMDFSGQDLTNADFSMSMVPCNFSGAILKKELA